MITINAITTLDFAVFDCFICIIIVMDDEYTFLPVNWYCNKYMKSPSEEQYNNNNNKEKKIIIIEEEREEEDDDEDDMVVNNNNFIISSVANRSMYTYGSSSLSKHSLLSPKES